MIQQKKIKPIPKSIVFDRKVNLDSFAKKYKKELKKTLNANPKSAKVNLNT